MNRQSEANYLPKLPCQRKATLLTGDDCRELIGHALLNRISAQNISTVQIGRLIWRANPFLTDRARQPTPEEIVDVLCVYTSLRTLALPQLMFSTLQPTHIERLRLHGAFASMETLDIDYQATLDLKNLFELLSLMHALKVLHVRGTFVGDGLADCDDDAIDNIPDLTCQLRAFSMRTSGPWDFCHYTKLLHGSSRSLKMLDVSWTFSPDGTEGCDSLLAALDVIGPSIHTLRTVGNMWTDGKLVRRCPSLKVLVLGDGKGKDAVWDSLYALTQPLPELRIVGSWETSTIHEQGLWLLEMLPSMQSLCRLKTIRLHAFRFSRGEEQVDENHSLCDLEEMCKDRGIVLDSAWVPDYRM